MEGLRAVAGFDRSAEHRSALQKPRIAPHDRIVPKIALLAGMG
jgi:hypothetical protein